MLFLALTETQTMLGPEYLRDEGAAAGSRASDAIPNATSATITSTVHAVSPLSMPTKSQLLAQDELQT